jgi:hypothetical protein
MVQLTMFPMQQGQIEIGDAASDKNPMTYVWAVEDDLGTGDWGVTLDMYDVPLTYCTRHEARQKVKILREDNPDREFRVTAMKRCIDTCGRVNRQVRSERLDY